MPVPVYVPGQIIGASDVDEWWVPLGAYKTTSTSRISTTTQAADPDLGLAFPQPGIWVIEAVVRFHGPSGANLSWGWETSSTSIAGDVCQLYNNSSGAIIIEYRPWTYAANLAETTGVGNEFTIRFNGLVSVGSGGNFAFAWAQGTSNATGVFLDPGSYLMGWRAN